ncbi:MAG: isoprenyl transferase [Deltaproteobacteria bacterium]|nr:isoprenyl transferase [Deltaproteobacteria bacterium]
MKEIDPKRLPRHIAIIMDGNGRWAESHTMGRILGHRKGAESVRTVTRTCRRIGIPCLTLYAFSVENWLRPKTEVRALMNLLLQYLETETQEMMEQDIRLTAIGNLDSLDRAVLGKLRETIEKTAGNRGMILNLALSYGGRDEITGAVKRIVADVMSGKVAPSDVTKELCSKYLYTADLPDPDLLIRTGGEYRISNFLLWQAAYAEFYFTDIFWPDFGEADLLAAIAEYQRRERRFGLTSDQIGRGTRNKTDLFDGSADHSPGRSADVRKRTRGGDA